MVSPLSLHQRCRAACAADDAAVGPAVDDDGGAAGGRLDAGDGGLGLEVPRYLDAEIDLQAGSGRTGNVVVEEDVVAIAAQARVVAQKGPYLVQGGREGLRNLTYPHTPAHRSQDARRNGLHRDGMLPSHRYRLRSRRRSRRRLYSAIV